MHIKGQGHSLTFSQGNSDSTFSNFFFLETAWPIEAKFYVAPPWDKGLKVWSNGLGHMTKVAAMPIYGKKLKISSSVEPKGRWSRKLVCIIGYSSLFKSWLWGDIDLFYGKVKFGPLCFCMGKKVKQWIFFRNYVVYYIKVGRCWWSTKWVQESLWVPQVKVIHWPWSKSLRLHINFFPQ